MTTLTPDQRDAIAAFVADHPLVHGLGTEEAACTVAAVNLALTGKLTDDVPECMSEVIGRWIIPTQDRLPVEFLNSDRWRSLIPLAAGTGRDHEPERLALVMDWMWERLALLQPYADKHGFGEAWQRMTTERTREAAAAVAAAAVAYAVAAAAAAYAADAAYVADAAVAAAVAAAAYVADAAYAAAAYVADAAVAADAAYVADAAVAAAAYPESCASLLERLIAVGSDD